MSLVGLLVLSAVVFGQPPYAAPPADGWVPFECAERLPDDEYGDREPVPEEARPASRWWPLGSPTGTTAVR